MQILKKRATAFWGIDMFDWSGVRGYPCNPKHWHGVFKDFHRIGNHSEAANSFQRVRIVFEKKGIIVLRGRLEWVHMGKTKVQPARFHAISGTGKLISESR